MPINIEFGVPGEKAQEISRLIYGYDDQIKNMSPFFAKMMTLVAKEVKKNFQEEGRPNKWTKLKPKYEKWKKKHYPNKKILQLSGFLFNAATKKDAPGNWNYLDNDRMEWGVMKGDVIPYSRAHQVGNRTQKARPYIILNASAVKKISSMAYAFLYKLVRRRK